MDTDDKNRGGEAKRNAQYVVITRETKARWKNTTAELIGRADCHHKQVCSGPKRRQLGAQKQQCSSDIGEGHPLQHWYCSKWDCGGDNNNRFTNSDINSL